MKRQRSHRRIRQALFPVCDACEITIDRDFPAVVKVQVSVGKSTRMKLCSVVDVVSVPVLACACGWGKGRVISVC